MHWCAGYVSWIPILDWGCSMLGKVFLNIFCGFLSFKNFVQCWASGLTLYLLQLISLCNVGQDKFHAPLFRTEAMQCLAWWSWTYNVVRYRLQMLCNVRQGIWTLFVTVNFTVQCWERFSWTNSIVLYPSQMLCNGGHWDLDFICHW